MEGKEGQTERATAKRRGKERRKGNLCMSQEITSMVVLLMGILILRFTSGWVWWRLTAFFANIASFDGVGEWSAQSAGHAFAQGTKFVGILLAPLLSTVVCASVVANMAQTKPYFSTETLKWKWSALNPVKGFKKLFSLKSLVDLGVTLLKLSFITVSIIFVVRPEKDVFMSLSQVTVIEAVRWMFLLVFKIALWVACLHVIIAILDWSFKKYKHEKGMMMTKQEVKDEFKQTERSPLVKKAQMRKMRALSLSRMIAAVPQASVIITNPTHVAVALQYDPKNMGAPKVTAKGLDFLALRIRKIAEEHKVPIVERPEVARALYKHVEVGGEIPGKFYEAVAGILAYLHKIGKGIKV